MNLVLGETASKPKWLSVDSHKCAVDACAYAGGQCS